MAEEMRKMGMDILGDLPWGTHLCQFYQTTEDLIDILVPYFKAGLENNEFCMWVTSEPLKAEDAETSLKKVVKNLDNYVRKGQIEILNASQWYTKSGKFESHKVLQRWVEKENQALKRGFDGLRLTGNTLWLEKRDWRDFVDYEATLNDVIGKYRMIVICSYSSDRCGASEVIDVVCNHHFALIRREGKWELIESTERKRAEEELRQYREHLEELVEERTAQLIQANEQLQREITERKRVEGVLRESQETACALLNASTAAAFLIDTTGTILAVNETGAQGFDKSIDEINGLRITDFLPTKVAENRKRRGIEVIRSENPVRFEDELEGRCFDINIHPVFNEQRKVIRLAIYARDITERKRVAEELQRFAGEREVVAKIGRIVDSTLEIDKVYELFAQEVSKVIPFDRIAINVIDPERETLTIAYIVGEDVEGRRPGGVVSLAGSLTQEVMQTRSSMLIQTDDRDDVVDRFPLLLPTFMTGFRSIMAVPLVSKDQVIAVMHLRSFKPEAYTASDVELAESIGSQIAGAIANAQLYQELKRQWAFSTTLIDTMSEGMGVLDEKGRLEFANRRLLQLLDYSLEEAMRLHWTCLVHPDDHLLVRTEGRSKKKVLSSAYECRLLRKDGTPVPILISWARRFDDQGQHKGTVGIITDMTERKRAERRLREHEARYRHLLDHMPDGVALTRRKRIIRANSSMARMFGFPSVEKMKGLNIWDLAARGSKEIMRQESTMKALRRQGENRFEFQALRRDGQAFPAEVTLTLDPSQPRPFVLAIFRDISEREKYERQRRLLSDRIMTAQERERTLIARELHDELGQALTGIKIDMSWIKNHIKSPDEAVSHRFTALGELIDSTIESVRKMATTLRPSLLDRLGLVAAIEWHASEFERRTGIECIVESETPDFNITSKTAINAYRIVQEALTNVARHAGASRVNLHMAKDRGDLIISISDNGKGIPSGSLSGPESLGIAGMRERAELVKGKLDIQSKRGKGTMVTAYLPLSLQGG